MLLDQKCALVTGVGDPDSIGFAIARSFIAQGARVAILDIDGAAVAKAGRILGATATPFQIDVSAEAEVQATLALIEGAFGRLDVVVNNAGIAKPTRTPDLTEGEFNQTMAVNMTGTFLVTQKALPLMVPGSSVICMASIAAQRGGGLLGGPHYAASKGAVIGFVRALAREQGANGIRVNAVCPGVIMSSMTRGFYDAALTARVMPQIPLGRFGETDDVAGVCLFLASDLSAYVTGACIDVNGGMQMS